MIRKVNNQTELNCFAALYYKGKMSNEHQWAFSLAFAGKDKQEAAGFCQTQEKLLTGQGYQTLILCGDFTHMVEPPPPPKLTLLKLED